MFTLRFDMRAPATGAPAADLYAASLDMAGWAEQHGCLSALLCEHHLADDGYLPSPMVLASAIAARTTSLPITIAIVILPLYDPIRLAEEMIVLDILAKGRVMVVAAIGYRPVEYELFGVDYHRRGKIADEKLEVLLAAKTGESFESEGRTFRLTPSPFTPGGPYMAWGGGTIAAAERAGRHGIGFFAQKGDPELGVAYEEAARAAGPEPGMCILTPSDATTTVFVAEDVDRAWEELGPYLMHDVHSYAEWNEATNKGNLDSASLSFVSTAEELRAENRSHRILSVDEAVELVRGGTPLPLHPLIGGLPPEIAWQYLNTVADKVMPALQS
jgi:alkanesulfonate monooxygenase SsuD/methylene tetrahydromethanopterin reductase-like flavin-dependent oxidoreductase (luciferase family)